MTATEKTRRNRLIVELPPGEKVILMRREFDFPRDLVWRVYTDGQQMQHWWGPRKYDTVVHAFDFRPGGKWRVDNLAKDGSQAHRFHGEFLSINAPNEFTWTFGYANFPPGKETYRFIDLDGRTRIETESIFASVEARDATAAGGMEEGAIETFERLDALLEKISKGR